VKGAPISTLDELKKKTRDLPAQPPVLNPRSKEPISLDFRSRCRSSTSTGRRQGLRHQRAFDPALKDQELAIELREVTAQTALETLMRAAGHFYKVIDERSIIIAATTRRTARTTRTCHPDLLPVERRSEGRAHPAAQLIGAKNIATNEQLNAVTIRDTADKVKVAQKMIEGIDKSKSEVIVDVELIEVDTNKFRELE